jgi:hypothetical protein
MMLGKSNIKYAIYSVIRYSYPSTGLVGRPFGLQGVEAPRISIKLAHE